MSQRGIVNVELRESSGDNAAFSAALANSRQADTVNGWAVTLKSREELDSGGVRTFMDERGATGFGIAPDGDIVAVFANKAAGAPRGATKSTIPMAIANGGKKLDCYGIGLVRLYAKYGFIPVARTRFNPEYANDGWTPDKGTPDIYFMMYSGEDGDTVAQKYGTYPVPTPEQLAALPEMEYDEAFAYRDKLLAEQEAARKAPERRKGFEAMGAADRDFTGKAAYQDLLTDDNVQPDRPGDVRPMEVPKKDGYGRDVSEFAANAYAAEATPDRMAIKTPGFGLAF